MLVNFIEILDILKPINKISVLFSKNNDAKSNNDYGEKQIQDYYLIVHNALIKNREVEKFKYGSKWI